MESRFTVWRSLPRWLPRLYPSCPIGRLLHILAATALRDTPVAKRITFIRWAVVFFITTSTSMSIPRDHRVGRNSGAPAAIALHSKEYSMITTAIGLLLGLAIGVGCRWFDIPAPSPPKIVGALLVVSMTLGYL